MAEGVKPRRRYESPRRRAQADATRRDILEAAQRLFEANGYAATTMADIATEAAVALKTVYLAFQTKSGLLRTLWNLLLRGDESDQPVAERPWYREVLDEKDPEHQLRLNARNSTTGKQRLSAILEVIRSAAAVDTEVAELWQRIQTDYHANQRAIVERLHQRRQRARASTSTAPPTSSGRSTTPTPGSCSSPTEAGRQTNTSNGPATSPAHNSYARRQPAPGHSASADQRTHAARRQRADRYRARTGLLRNTLTCWRPYQILRVTNSTGLKLRGG